MDSAQFAADTRNIKLLNNAIYFQQQRYLFKEQKNGMM